MSIATDIKGEWNKRENESDDSKDKKENKKVEEVKIQTETKVANPEIALQQVREVIAQLNQELGKEVYTLSGAAGKTDGYDIMTMVINVKYLGRDLTSLNLEICVNEGRNGLQRGINPEADSIKTLIKAATIQFKSGLSKDGILVEQNEI